MGHRPDKQKVIFAEGCISQGMMDGQSVRALMDKFGCSQATAYRYLDLAYKEYALVRQPDLEKKKARIEFQISAQMRRALGRVTYLPNGERVVTPNLTEVGKCIDRLMRLQGFDKQTFEIAPKGEYENVVREALAKSSIEAERRLEELEKKSGTS